MPISSAAEAREIVAEVGGGTSYQRGEELHAFVLEQKPTNCLELGVAHGVSSVWIASALEANGEGHLTSVDIEDALSRDPLASELLQRAGLSARVDLVFEQTSYTWFLQRMLRERLRGETIEPIYDFVFIDGAHTWDADALAFELVDRLVKPGGWIVLDDLDWTQSPEDYPDVPDSQRQIAQIKEIWELLAVTNPQYDELRTDGQWGFARKSTNPTPTVRVIKRNQLVASIRTLLRVARSKFKR